MLLALSVTGGVLIFATLILRIIFKNVDPAIVKDNYRKCAGNWYEGHLQGCQAGLTKIPQQPVNTYTNLAYLASGFFITLFLDTPPSYVFVCAMVYLFIGSTLYHAMSTYWAGMLDVTAIYSLFSATAVYALCVLLGSPVWFTTMIMFVAAGLTAYLLSPVYKKNMNLIIAIFLGVTYLLVIINMVRTGNTAALPYLIGSFVAFFIAFIIWNLDRAHKFPLKRWGHGIWHILCAAATGLVFYAIHLTA